MPLNSDPACDRRLRRLPMGELASGSAAAPGSGKAAKNRKREEQRRRAKERAASGLQPSHPAGAKPESGGRGGGRGGDRGRGRGGDRGRGRGGDRGRGRGGDRGRGRGGDRGGGRGRGRGRGASELDTSGRDAKEHGVEDPPSGFQHLVIIPIYWKQREGERAAVVDVCLAVKAFCGELLVVRGLRASTLPSSLSVPARTFLHTEPHRGRRFRSNAQAHGVGGYALHTDAWPEIRVLGKGGRAPAD